MLPSLLNGSQVETLPPAPRVSLTSSQPALSATPKAVVLDLPFPHVSNSVLVQEVVKPVVKAVLKEVLVESVVKLLTELKILLSSYLLLFLNIL